MANNFGVITSGIKHNDVNDIKTGLNQGVAKLNADKNSGGLSFSEVLTQSIDNVNTLQQTSEKALADMATGQIKDLHQAAIAINKAENSMKVMLEVRNKAINAYKEILRTQV